MKMLLLLCLAGSAGTLLRHAVSKGLNACLPQFPWGTFAVNAAGSFLAGLLFVVCRKHFSSLEAYFPVLFVGFFGAFTTFSTYALETGRFALEGQYGKALCNVLLHAGICLTLAWTGLFLGQRFCH